MTKRFKVLDHRDDEFVKKFVKNALVMIELKTCLGYRYYRLAGVVTGIKSSNRGVTVKCFIFDKYRQDLKNLRIKHKSVLQIPGSPLECDVLQVCTTDHPTLLLSEY